MKTVIFYTLLLLMPCMAFCQPTITATGKKLALQMTLLYNQSEFRAKDYGFLKDFYKKLFNLLEEPIVVKQQ